MDEKTYQERVKKLIEINKIIEKLDPSIREEGFKLLQSYITGKEEVSGRIDEGKKETEQEVGNEESFFGKFGHTRPCNNALLISAYLYNQFGTSPFSLNDVKKLADKNGITIPSRCDTTLRNAKREGKNLFTKVGKDKYKPTVHGEEFLKKTYNVSKGKKTKDPEAIP